MTKGLACSIRRNRHHVANLDLLVGDHNVIDEQFHQGAPLREACFLEAGADLCTKRFRCLGDFGHFNALARQFVQLLLLSLKDTSTLIQVGTLALELGQLECFAQIGVKEAILLAFSSRDRLREVTLAGLKLLG